MKALVTGATGFIGSHLVRELLKDGTEVRVLVRKNSDTRNIDGLDIEKAYGDIRDGESVKSALQGCDTFYQMAALYNMWMPDNKLFYEINVEGTKTALNAALEHGVEKVVYTSTIAAVGYYGPDNPGNENAEYNLWNHGNHYSRSKYLGEIEAKKLCDKGLPLVIVNPSAPVGTRDIRPTPTGQQIVSFLNGKVPGYVDSGVNFVDVEDVARGHILAARKGRIGERYILGNENLPIKEYFELLAEVAGVEPPRKKIPSRPLLAMAYGCEFIARITGKPPLISVAMARMSDTYAYFDCSKAVNELGLPQTPVRTALEKAVNWFRENGYVKGQ